MRISSGQLVAIGLVAILQVVMIVGLLSSPDFRAWSGMGPAIVGLGIAIGGLVLAIPRPQAGFLARGGRNPARLPRDARGYSRSSCRCRSSLGYRLARDTGCRSADPDVGNVRAGQAAGALAQADDRDLAIGLGAVVRVLLAPRPRSASRPHPGPAPRRSPPARRHGGPRRSSMVASGSLARLWSHAGFQMAPPVGGDDEPRVGGLGRGSRGRPGGSGRSSRRVSRGSASACRAPTARAAACGTAARTNPLPKRAMNFGNGVPSRALARHLDGHERDDTPAGRPVGTMRNVG